MLKKTITYTDFNGTERVEDFYFNISKSELISMELMEQQGDEMDQGIAAGAFARRMQSILDSKSGRQIMTAFTEIITDAYGERTPDGRSFLKSKDITARFVGTPAYDVLFLELITDGAKAAAFIRGIVPQDIAEETVRASQPILDSAGIDRETQSRLAREASEANLQGHKKKDHEGSDIREVPSVPTINQDETDTERKRRELTEQLAALDN